MTIREHAAAKRGTLALTLASCATLGGLDASAASVSRFSDQPAPLQTEGFPSRPEPLLELGEDFLGTGTLKQGVELPTGAVWHPSFLLFGSLRSALQTFDDGSDRFSEWTNRLNLFGQLRLSGTERLIVGLRPLDQDGRFSGYHFEPEQDDGWRDETNLKVDRLFFEGDIGEIFPGLDPTDTHPLDVGFAVGRQPIFYQEGMLIDDTIDSLGVVRNSLAIEGGSNARITLLYGWNEIHRANNRLDDSASVFGLFTEMDLPRSTLDIDLVYVGGDYPGLYGGISSVQRIGHLNSSVRALFSAAQDGESAYVNDGTLLFGEFSFSPTGTHDNLYANAFWGIGSYSSAARGPATGGPLGRTGILFAAVGMGRYGAALGNGVDDAYGAALGYQMFLSGGLKQWIFEVGFREETQGPEQSALALGARYQQAFGQHLVMRFDGFVADREEGGNSNGLRAEALYKF